MKVWQRSHSLALRVYRLTKALPGDEKYGLVSQLRRAAVSVPTNIAEGSKREGNQDFARFLNIAEGSLAETEYLIMLSRDLDYLTPTSVAPLLLEIKEVARMLHYLRMKVEPKAQRMSSKAA
ncbi:MAG TPA: four helix bundle protein [Terriglobia bacterium]|nr:four helix bundle protein [Terriglobia bacterium]